MKIKKLVSVIISAILCLNMVGTNNIVHAQTNEDQLNIKDTFADEYLIKYFETYHDPNKDGIITSEEWGDEFRLHIISNSFDLDEKDECIRQIRSLKGLDNPFFSKRIKDLYLYNLNLWGEINISGLKNLELFKLEIAVVQENTNENWFVFEDMPLLEKVDINYDNTTKAVFRNCESLYDITVLSGELENLEMENIDDLCFLIAPGNKLKSVDLSNYKDLFYLNLSYNKLKKIDISNNAEITYLYLNGNKISKLNTSKNPKLRFLQLKNTKLEKSDLNFKNNPYLREEKRYTVNNDEVIEVDLNLEETIESEALRYYITGWFDKDKDGCLNTFEASYMDEVYVISAFGEDFEDVSFPLPYEDKAEALSKIDSIKGLEKIKTIKYLRLDETGMEGGKVDFSGFDSLKRIFVGTPLKVASFKGLKNIETIECQSRGSKRAFEKINLKGCKNLRKLNVSSASKTLKLKNILHLSDCKKLEEFDISDVKLKKLNVSKFKNLKKIDVRKTGLKVLNLRKNKKIKKIKKDKSTKVLR